MNRNEAEKNSPGKEMCQKQSALKFRNITLFLLLNKFSKCWSSLAQCKLHTHVLNIQILKIKLGAYQCFCTHLSPCIKYTFKYCSTQLYFFQHFKSWYKSKQLWNHALCFYTRNFADNLKFNIPQNITYANGNTFMDSHHKKYIDWSHL